MSNPNIDEAEFPDRHVNDADFREVRAIKGTITDESDLHAEVVLTPEMMANNAVWLFDMLFDTGQRCAYIEAVYDDGTRYKWERV
jgi:hypothetical protein